MLYSMAALVALSRIVRGSHFPTDVMAGVSLGLLAGCVITRPLRAWRHSLLLALTMGTPFLVTAFAFIWIAVYPSFDEPMTLVMLIMGVIALGLGMTVRLHHRLDARRRDPHRAIPLSPGSECFDWERSGFDDRIKTGDDRGRIRRRGVLVDAPSC